MIEQIIINLFLTIFIELVVLLLLKIRDKKILLISVFLNILTNVPLNIFLLNYTFSKTSFYILLLILAELFVVVVESAVYYLFIRKKRQAFLISLIANASSYFIGLIISLIVLWLS